MSTPKQRQKRLARKMAVGDYSDWETALTYLMTLVLEKGDDNHKRSLNTICDRECELCGVLEERLGRIARLSSDLCAGDRTSLINRIARGKA